jgi:DNA topoisomerase-1
MKKLLIVESPAKIKTISKFLGKEFKIMSTMGHVKDLPAKRLGVTINGTIEVEYVPIEDKDKVIAEICKEARSCQAIYLAPDPDREGEIIAWHIANEIEKVVKNPDAIHRIAFNEITKNAVVDAIDNPSIINAQRVSAQQARRILDRWVGYQVSPVLWKKIAPGLSAGRVQSVALRLICDREDAIRAFKPEEYWTVDGLFKHGKDTFNAPLAQINKKKIDLKNEADTKKVVDALKKESFVISEIADKQRTKNPLAPFMTSTLQQAAYNQLGFSVKKTMQVAQQLYEGVPLSDPKTPVALITYMRTDSLRLSETAITQARSYIKEQFSKDYLPKEPNAYAKKSKGPTQDAHEAIRPVDVTITPTQAKKYLSNDAAKLYELIWKRFVACQMTPALYAQRQVTITGGVFMFRVTGSTLIFDGFLKVYAASDDDEKEDKVILPAGLKENDPVALNVVTPKQHFTQPPPRYTEASLVKELEKEGIGRPSTYATILTTIRARAYTTLDTKKRFVPTELGMTVTKMLVDNLPHIMDPKFTALMEQDLDKIADGELERDTLLRDFYDAFQKDLKDFLGSDAKREAVTTDVECPECKKKKLAIRFGKSGEFLGCLGFPECSFTSNFKRNEQGEIELIQAEKPQLLEETCPQCGKQLRAVRGKFGTFTACSGYPECKFIKQTKASFACPMCKGDVVQKVWRGGSFWGCGNYPKCKFAVFDQVEETPCPSCKWPFITKKVYKDGKVLLGCANKSCSFKKEE